MIKSKFKFVFVKYLLLLAFGLAVTATLLSIFGGANVAPFLAQILPILWRILVGIIPLIMVLLTLLTMVESLK